MGNLAKTLLIEASRALILLQFSFAKEGRKPSYILKSVPAHPFVCPALVQYVKCVPDHLHLQQKQLNGIPLQS